MSHLIDMICYQLNKFYLGVNRKKIMKILYCLDRVKMEQRKKKMGEVHGCQIKRIGSYRDRGRAKREKKVSLISNHGSNSK